MKTNVFPFNGKINEVKMYIHYDNLAFFFFGLKRNIPALRSAIEVGFRLIIN